MKRILVFFLLISCAHGARAQFHLIVNEFSQGNGGTKEFIELLVVGTRTCTDSTADIRNWIFDDQNGWYGAAGAGIATGHYRFSNDANWQKVPYGSIILIYNNSDQNASIPAGASDPTDADHDYVYILPINNGFIEQNSSTPSSPSAVNFVYPATGYSPSGSWSSLGLANSGDAVIIADPANPGVAHFSILFGLTAGAGFQTPTVTVGEVAGNKSCYLRDDQYSVASSWSVGNAGSADETPGAGNTAANNAWIQLLRVQANAVVPDFNLSQPTCISSTGTITITAPTGTGYTYSIDGINFQASPVFPGLAPDNYTITAQAAGGCSSTAPAVINPAPALPDPPTASLIQPDCSASTGTITITAPTGAGYTYSIDGINFQASPVFAGLAPDSYTITAQTAGGCSSTAPAVINPAPALPDPPTASLIQPDCSASTGTITITAPTGAGYTYSIDGINFQASPVFPGLAPDSYTITAQAAGGCSSTAPAVINPAPALPDPPTPSVTQPTCSTPTGTITITAPTGTGYTYSIDGINFQASPVFAGLAPDSYTITAQEAGGCTTTAPAVINVPPAAPAAPVVSSPVDYCQDADAVSLAATGSSILWYSNPTGGAGSSTAPIPSTAIAATTTYYVSQTVNGCESPRAAINVVVTTPVDLPPITGNTAICVHGNATAALSNATAGGVWSSADPSVAIVDNNGQVTGLSAGSATIRYTVSSGGCSSSVSTTVNPGDFILNLIAAPNPATQGTAVNLNTSAAAAYQIITWLPLTDFSDQTATSQLITATNPIVYTAVGQGANGCIDTAQVSLAVTFAQQDIFVPNVFTPNNDGKNDELHVYGNTIAAVDFRIFNQWGEAIFYTTDKNKGWDGRYKGVMQPVAVYIYTLKATLQNGTALIKKGSVTIIR